MIFVIIYLLISTLVSIGLYVLLSRPNEDCTCGQCDQHDERWHLVREKVAQMNLWQFSLFWTVFVLLSLPVLAAILANCLYDYLMDNSENAV
jgi:hypothetical protein